MVQLFALGRVFFCTSRSSRNKLTGAYACSSLPMKLRTLEALSGATGGGSAQAQPKDSGVGGGGGVGVVGAERSDHDDRPERGAGSKGPSRERHSGGFALSLCSACFLRKHKPCCVNTSAAFREGLNFKTSCVDYDGWCVPMYVPPPDYDTT